MKLLIASDIHGSADAAIAIADRVKAEKPDRIVLLGDLLYHGPRNPLPAGYDPMRVAGILNGWKDRIVAVRGNCDSEVDQMVLEFSCRSDYTLVEADGHLLHLSHGHLPGNAPDDLPPLPEGSAFVSGHTHVKKLERSGGVLLVNPGSPSLPKDGVPSYALYENGVFSLKTLDGEVLASMGWNAAS